MNLEDWNYLQSLPADTQEWAQQYAAATDISGSALLLCLAPILKDPPIKIVTTDKSILFEYPDYILDSLKITFSNHKRMQSIVLYATLKTKLISYNVLPNDLGEWRKAIGGKQPMPYFSPRYRERVYYTDLCATIGIQYADR